MFHDFEWERGFATRFDLVRVKQELWKRFRNMDIGSVIHETEFAVNMRRPRNCLSSYTWLNTTEERHRELTNLI